MNFDEQAVRFTKLIDQLSLVANDWGFHELRQREHVGTSPLVLVELRELID